MRNDTLKGITSHLLSVNLRGRKKCFSLMLLIRYSSRRNSCVFHAETTYLGCKLENALYFASPFDVPVNLIRFFSLALNTRHHLTISFLYMNTKHEQNSNGNKISWGS